MDMDMDMLSRVPDHTLRDRIECQQIVPRPPAANQVKISSMSKSTRISASYNSKSERALRAKERRAQVALSIDRLAQVLGINKKDSESYIANILEETLAYIKGMEALPGI